MKILKNYLNKFLIFPLSGGVIAKKKMIEIPTFLYPLIKFIDKLLIFVAPNIFALGRSVVLKNVKLNFQ